MGGELRAGLRVWWVRHEALVSPNENEKGPLGRVGSRTSFRC